VGSTAARLVAANKAVRLKAGDAERFTYVWRVTQQIGHRHVPSTVYVRRKRKDDTRYRLICQFTATDKAQQHLLALALRPFLSIHPAQFGTRRGRSAAVESLLRHLAGCHASDCFVHTDVVGFHDAVSHDWLEENLPLPVGLTRSSVHTGGIRLFSSGSRHARPSAEDIERMGRRGIPQGSALSSLIADWVMADVLRTVADPSFLEVAVNYSDNLGAPVPRGETERLVECLRVGFAAHPAGPFQITSSVRRLSQGFKFLGYRFEQNPRHGHFQVGVPRRVWEPRLYIYLAKLAECNSARDIEIVRGKMRSYCSAFGSWRGAKHLKGLLMRCADRQLGQVRVESHAG
jgi:RNA-directed DNA polymerase